MARRVLPVDEAVVLARRILAQRLELGAFTLLDLRLDAVDRLLDEKLQRRAVHAAHVRHDFDGPVHRDAADEFHKRERPAPAQPDLIDMHAAATLRNDRKRDAAVAA